jgi:hypothetical protein
MQVILQALQLMNLSILEFCRGLEASETFLLCRLIPRLISLFPSLARRETNPHFAPIFVRQIVIRLRDLTSVHYDPRGGEFLLRLRAKKSAGCREGV